MDGWVGVWTDRYRDVWKGRWMNGWVGDWLARYTVEGMNVFGRRLILLTEGSIPVVSFLSSCYVPHVEMKMKTLLEVYSAENPPAASGLCSSFPTAAVLSSPFLLWKYSAPVVEPCCPSVAVPWCFLA